MFKIDQTFIFKVLALVGSTLLTIGICEILVIKFEKVKTNKRVLSLEQFEHQSEIDLDSLHYNESIVSKKKSKDSVRILSFGDSFAYGIVRYPYTYHAVAARKMSKSLKKPVKIVNLGEPAISFTQYVNSYSLWSKLIEHDAVVFNIYLGNDVLDEVNGWTKKDQGVNELFLNMDANPAKANPHSGKVPEKYPLRIMDYLRSLYITYFRQAFAPARKFHYEYNWAVIEIAESEFYRINKNQADILDISKLPNFIRGYEKVVIFARHLAKIRSQGTPVFVLLSPSQLQMESPLRDRVATHFQLDKNMWDPEFPAFLIRSIFNDIDQKIAIIDLANALACGYGDSEPLYFKTDTHWSTKGNSLVGQELADRLLAELYGLFRPANTECKNPIINSKSVLARRNAYELYIKPILYQPN